MYAGNALITNDVKVHSVRLGKDTGIQLWFVVTPFFTHSVQFWLRKSNRQQTSGKRTLLYLFGRGQNLCRQVPYTRMYTQ